MTTAPEKVSTGSTAESSKTIEKSDLVTLTIDGVSVSVPKDTLVIRAAEQVGVQIPRFCDHPLLAPVGACRQCLVDVPDAGNGRPMPKPQASCTMPVSEGMVVNTQVTSPVADKAQQGVMEFLLINHPLDCPVCDKGGECPLQNQAMSNGRGDSRFAESGGVKRTFPKPIHLSAQVLLDRERCVLCARCTRFSEQIAGDPFIALADRGAQQQVAIYEKEAFESYFSGNTIQICPVGALTSAEYRFRSRPFDLVSSPAIAEHDACGAAIRVDHRRGKVMRRLAGNDPEVNEEWITDKDRFAFHYAKQPDRLTYPLVRDQETGEQRPASWPEAFAVAARGLRFADSSAVLTGGRLIAEDAYAYSKFARVALETNDIDFRARPHSAEEADFLASEVVLRQSATYADLEAASTVLLVGLEPEDEAGTIFLRLRKASQQKSSTQVVSLAPYTSWGLAKMNGRLIQTAPGDEAAMLRNIKGHSGSANDWALDEKSVILVGERLATSPGALTAAAEIAKATGAKLAWVPRRAGDRGAVETGCLPNLLPGGRPVADAAARVDAATAWGVSHLPSRPGRDGDAILAALAAGQVSGLVIGGVDLRDLADPDGALEAIRAARFVVALEQRETDVTRAADVVFPVAPVTDKAGMFVTWEGRPRTFDAVLANPAALPDLRILAGIAEELGHPLGFRTVAEARAQMDEVGPWDGERAVVGAPASAEHAAAANHPGRSSLTTGGPSPSKAAAAHSADAGAPAAAYRLATWKLLLDNGRMQDGDDNLRATARRTVARVSPTTYDGLGAGAHEVTITGDRGSVTLPVEVADLPDDVVWVPQNSFGRGVHAELSSPGGTVSVESAAKGAAQ
jgi:NADH-quinone oxidoreductase subunit G